MRHRLFNFAAAVSLVLCLATVVLWVRSYSKANYLRYQSWTHPITYAVRLIRGTLQVDHIRNAPHELLGDGTAFHAGHWGNWEHGEVDFRLNLLGDTVYDVGFADPSSTWGPFGWSAETYPHSGLWSGVRPPAVVRHSFFFPIWMVCCATLVLPTIWLTSLIRRARRMADGCCPFCNYNLTGNVSGVCPECGTPVAAGVKV